MGVLLTVHCGLPTECGELDKVPFQVEFDLDTGSVEILSAKIRDLTLSFDQVCDMSGDGGWITAQISQHCIDRWSQIEADEAANHFDLIAAE